MPAQPVVPVMCCALPLSHKQYQQLHCSIDKVCTLQETAGRDADEAAEIAEQEEEKGRRRRRGEEDLLGTHSSEE